MDRTAEALWSSWRIDCRGLWAGGWIGEVPFFDRSNDVGSYLVATPSTTPPNPQLTRTGTPQSLHMLDYMASPEEVAGMDEMQAAVWTQQQGLADAIDWVVRCACAVLCVRWVVT